MQNEKVLQDGMIETNDGKCSFAISETLNAGEICVSGTIMMKT